MVVRVLLGVVGAFHFANGLVMLAAPAAWAAAVVHLGAPDHLHFHFITDIGMAFAASGVGMLLGTRRGIANGAYAAAGATWPALHGLFHLKEWITDGLPPTLQGRISEGVGVILIGALGVTLAWLRLRKGDV